MITHFNCPNISLVFQTPQIQNMNVNMFVSDWYAQFREPLLLFYLIYYIIICYIILYYILSFTLVISSHRVQTVEVNFNKTWGLKVWKPKDACVRVCVCLYEQLVWVVCVLFVCLCVCSGPHLSGPWRVQWLMSSVRARARERQWWRDQRGQLKGSTLQPVRERRRKRASERETEQERKRAMWQWFPSDRLSRPSNVAILHCHSHLHSDGTHSTLRPRMRQRERES